MNKNTIIYFILALFVLIIPNIINNLEASENINYNDEILEETSRVTNIEPSHIFGSDDRERVEDAYLTFPYSAICRIVIRFHDNDGNELAGYSCTGALVTNPNSGNSNYVITAAHCLCIEGVDEEFQIADEIEVTFAVDGTFEPFAFEPFGEINVNNRDRIWVNEHWPTYFLAKYDYGLITLPVNIGNAVGSFDILYDQPKDVYKGKIETAGYPGDKSSQADEMYRVDGYGKAKKPLKHTYKLDCEDGQSGSPVFIYQSNYGSTCEILSILSGGYFFPEGVYHHNHGPRFTQKRYDELLDVMDEMDSNFPPEDGVDLIPSNTSASGLLFETSGSISHWPYEWECARSGIDNYVIYHDIWNNGTAYFADEFTVNYTMNQNTILNYQYIDHQERYNINIDPYRSTPVIAMGQFDSDLKEYLYDSIIVDVDAYNEIDEWIENNNNVIIDNPKLCIDNTQPIIDESFFQTTFRPHDNSNTPYDWVNTKRPNCSIWAADAKNQFNQDWASGIGDETVYYRFSNNGGTAHGGGWEQWAEGYEWWDANLEPDPQPTWDDCKVIAYEVPFGGFFWVDSDWEYVIQFKVKDYAGNYDLSKEYTVKIDTTAPPPPFTSSPSHPDETQWYTAQTGDIIDFHWEHNNPPPGDLSGIDGYSHDNIIYIYNPAEILWPCDEIKDSEYDDPRDMNINYQGSGCYNLQIRTCDNAGNWGQQDKFVVHIDNEPPGYWNNPTPEIIDTLTPDCKIEVMDMHSGLDVSTAEYKFSTDGGLSWSNWLSCFCTGSDGSNIYETITAYSVNFNEYSNYNEGIINQIKFRIKDMIGHEHESDPHTISIVEYYWLLTIEDMLGGIGVDAIVKNSGISPAEDIQYSFIFDGNIISGSEFTGTVSILPGEEVSIPSGFVVGFGPVSITFELSYMGDQGYIIEIAKKTYLFDLFIILFM
ncbi:trypsin-like serine peptidase [Thermoplasmatota archaeon]